MARIKNNPINLELMLITLFLTTTVWMLIGSFRLNSESSKLFPRLTGGVVMILFLVLLGLRLAPFEISELMPKNDTISYGDNDLQSDEFDEYNIFLVFLMFGGYIFSVYLIGFLISTPLYFYINLWHYEYGSWKQRSVIILATLIVLVVAYEAFRIPINQGLLL